VGVNVKLPSVSPATGSRSATPETQNAQISRKRTGKGLQGRERGRARTRQKLNGDGAGGTDPLESEGLALLDIEAQVGDGRLGEANGHEGAENCYGDFHGGGFGEVVWKFGS